MSSRRNIIELFQRQLQFQNTFFNLIEICGYCRDDEYNVGETEISVTGFKVNNDCGVLVLVCNRQFALKIFLLFLYSTKQENKDELRNIYRMVYWLYSKCQKLSRRKKPEGQRFSICRQFVDTPSGSRKDHIRFWDRCHGTFSTYVLRSQEKLKIICKK